MPCEPYSEQPEPKPGGIKRFGDVKLVAAPFDDYNGCSNCAFTNDKRVGDHGCTDVRCTRVVWVTPLQYITHRLTK